MIAVITGSNGYTASYLTRHIKTISPEIIICGLDLSEESHNDLVDQYFPADELHEMTEFLTRRNEPFKVFHLAGILKSDSLEILLDTNVLGSAIFVEAFMKCTQCELFMNIGSSAEYGSQTSKLLIESMAPNPVSPYGVSKSLQSQMVLSSAKIYGFKAISTRTFNLIGPGLQDKLVVGKLVKEYSRIKNKEKENIEIGRTDSIRNFIDVRDAVKIYWILSEKGTAGEIYNVGHPESYSIDQIIALLNEIMEVQPVFKKYPVQNLQFDIDHQFPGLDKTHKIVMDMQYRTIKDTLIDMIKSAA